MILISDKRDCCGCTACTNICPKQCIHMQDDDEGFRYPVIDLSSCVDCHMCESVCPELKPLLIKGNFTPETFALKHKDNSIRMKSSSGGAFDLLARYVIQNNGIVYGATYTSNFSVIHSSANTIQDCEKFHGSKYVQSQIPDFLFKEIKEKLLTNKLILFTGTPCQVAGLKSYLKKDFSNLITCDLVCSSVPSPRIFSDYIKFIQRDKEIQEINMRYKNVNFSGTKPCIFYRDKSMLIGKGDAKLWFSIAFSQLVSRPSCHTCKYATIYRQGDFTIGDFWGIEQKYSEFQDSKGVSLVFVNTEKSRKLFAKVFTECNLLSTEIDYSLQPRLLSPVLPNPLREQFWQEYNSRSFLYIAHKYWQYGLINQIKAFIRIFLSKLYHFIIK